jgi:predicted AlkP superfamily phosphohydrolase/phosphomutase
MTRLIIIGIDGMDPYVFENLERHCPNLSRLKQEHTYKRSASTFPPDSIPAWVSIFTGSHPAEHGWLDNVDYEDIRKGQNAIDMSRLQGNTFWDHAGNSGSRVCVINPLLAYPVWQVNGVMINGPVFISGEAQSYPPQIAHEFKLPPLGGMTDFPDEAQLADFIEKTFIATRQLAEFGQQLYAKEKWDLFFISFFTMDRLQHFLWRYYDNQDPTYPGPTQFEAAIPDLYNLFDQIVGEYLALTDEDVSIMVISDHGHGMRPLQQLNVNELLRRDGYLKTQGANSLFSYKRWIESSKNFVLNFLSAFGLENWSYTIGALIPKRQRKALKKSSFLIDKRVSLAWVSEMGSGTSTGGIEINSEIYRPGTKEYAGIAQKLVTLLQQYCGAEKDHPRIIKWVAIPQERKKQQFPAVIFELENAYSVGRAVFTDIITKSPRHQRVSGGHRSQGVFFWRGETNHIPGEISIMDYYQLIMDTLAEENR